IDTGHPDVLAWARDRLDAGVQARLDLRPGTEHTLEQVLDMWMQAYVPAHEGFAPVTDAAATREQFRTWFSDNLDLRPSFVARAPDGRTVAATLMTAEIDGILVPNLLDLAPGHGSALTGAAACVAATLLAVSPRPVEFEGHVDQDLYMSVMAMVPHRAAGVLTPMDMVLVRG